MIRLHVPWEKKDKWEMDPWEKVKYIKWERFRDFLEAIPYRLPKDFKQIMDRFKLTKHNPDIYDKVIRLNMPFNRALLAEVKVFMKEQGWQLDEEELKKGEDYLKYSKKSERFDLRFAFSYWHTGSTCKRIKIGSEKVTKDIYEIVCNEAAEEMGV